MTDLEQLLDEVEGWSQPSTYSATGVHQGYRRVTLVSGGKVTAAGHRWCDVLAPYAPVESAWLSWIDPGGWIDPHVDAGPWRERWQVPIRPSGTMNGVPAEPGVAFQVRHWEPHEVVNDGDRPRIHLVIDRDVIVKSDVAPFRKVAP